MPDETLAEAAGRLLGNARARDDDRKMRADLQYFEDVAARMMAVVLNRPGETLEETIARSDRWQSNRAKQREEEPDDEYEDEREGWR